MRPLDIQPGNSPTSRQEDINGDWDQGFSHSDAHEVFENFMDAWAQPHSRSAADEAASRPAGNSGASKASSSPAQKSSELAGHNLWSHQTASSDKSDATQKTVVPNESSLPARTALGFSALTANDQNTPLPISLSFTGPLFVARNPAPSKDGNIPSTRPPAPAQLKAADILAASGMQRSASVSTNATVSTSLTIAARTPSTTTSSIEEPSLTAGSPATAPQAITSSAITSSATASSAIASSTEESLTDASPATASTVSTLLGGMSSKAMHQNLPTVDGAVTSVRQPLTELAGQAKSADPAPLLVPDQTNAQLKTDIRGSHELADALAAGTEKNATMPTAAATSDLSASNDKGIEGSADQAIFDPAGSETASAASVTDAPTLAGAPATAAEIAGTGVATTDLPMKDPEEKNKVAGPGVKVLPVDDKDDAAENNLPPQVGAAVAHGSEGNGHLDLGFGSSPDQASGEANARILSSMDLPSLADARLRALDRTNDMLVLHSMRLEESNFI